MDIGLLIGYLIPLGVLIFIGATIYGKNKEGIDKAIEALKSMNKSKQPIEESPQDEVILTYK
jgi:hypothetical protein